MMGCDMLTQQTLKEHLSYDCETGIFTRVNNKGRFKAGSILGTKHSTGYFVIRINNKLYKSHRLAWLYAYGEFPDLVIDHINGNGFDNRLQNLRVVTQKQNCENQKLHKNNTSGHPGVDWSKVSNKWRAKITLNYKTIHIGLFENKDQAIDAYKSFAAKVHTHNSFAKI